jgi:hypothetical protein
MSPATLNTRFVVSNPTWGKDVCPRSFLCFGLLCPSLGRFPVQRGLTKCLQESLTEINSQLEEMQNFGSDGGSMFLRNDCSPISLLQDVQTHTRTPPSHIQRNQNPSFARFLFPASQSRPAICTSCIFLTFNYYTTFLSRNFVSGDREGIQSSFTFQQNP